MRFPRALWLSLSLLTAACASAPGAGPSLAPRMAEGIDPRVPVVPSVTTRPADPALIARLGGLIAQARSGDAAFEAALAAARRAAAAAGAPQSETWVAAQQALSVAVSARAGVTRALGDIDEIGSTRLASQGGLPPADLAAIETAAAEVAAIDRRQAAAVDALQARLGS